jgi:multiple sugar transport system ATP-binding protein
LDLKVPPGTMVAAVEPTVRAKIRDRVRLAMNPDRLHFFDARTEAAI